MVTSSKPQEGDVKIPTKEELLGTTEDGEVEGDDTQQADTKPQSGKQWEPTPDEEIAMTQGWVPKHEWKGDIDEWRPAKEFNQRGELFNRIKSQTREISELRAAMQMLVNKQSQQYVKGVEDTLAKLKRDRKTAAAENDMETVVAISEKIDEVSEAHRQAKQEAAQNAKATASTAPVGPSDTFVAWHQRNDWYGKDKVLSRFAESEGEEFRATHPNATEADMLAHVEGKVKAEFSHRFRKAPPSPDGDGRQSNRGRGSSQGNDYSEVEAQMSDVEQQIMKTILKTTKMSKADYLKQYAEAR